MPAPVTTFVPAATGWRVVGRSIDEDSEPADPRLRDRGQRGTASGRGGRVTNSTSILTQIMVAKRHAVFVAGISECRQTPRHRGLSCSVHFADQRVTVTVVPIDTR
jgi:hypothetical protein